MDTEKNEGVFEEIDLRQLLEVILKWKWVIAVIAVLAVATSAVLSFFVLPPVYETKTVLMVTHSADQQRYIARDDGSLEELVRTISRLPEMTINTYIGQLKNNSLLETVIKKLELEEEGYTVNSLSGMISAELVKDTNLIEVKVTNTEPEKAVLIADTLTKEFLSFISEKNKERMSQSVEVLKEQIAVIEQDLLIANDILKDFNRQPRSINFVQEELNSKMNDLTMYQSELIKSDIELDQLWAGKYQLEDSLAQVDSVLLKVTTEEKGMDPETGERVVVTTTTEEPNPEYQNLLAKYENKKQEIAQLEAKITGITAAVDALVQNLGELQTELTEKKSEFTAIMRDVERLEKSHSLFSERLAQTQIYESINIGETNLLIVAPALEPTSPFKPNKKLNIAIAFVLALMVGVFLAFILEFFDDNIKNAEDVKRYLDLPVMGSIPKIDSSVKTRRVY